MPDTEELEIIWIPEEEAKNSLTVENAQGVSELVDLPASTVDRICKKKYGHTNWARMGALYPEDLARNPHEIDYLEGIVYFKNLRMV
tara:strand:+ start:430 stop:690 length:261 start_codon:yes stop_codon:yes gene_type:complete